MTIDKVLIIDEQDQYRHQLETALKRKKREVVSVEKGHSALELLKHYPFDLILCDYRLSDIDSAEVLRASKERPHTLFILLVTKENEEAGVEFLQKGAFSYLQKPLFPTSLEIMLQKAEEHALLLHENHTLRQEISSSPRGIREKMIAESTIMKQLLRDVAKIAKSNASVFINGESGTGKEVIAHAIHFSSQRAGHPFIKVNCAAVPEPLIESEFFGYEKGAFTGAVQKKLGRFELADKGTLLLDEISEIPLGVQAKLLRAIQEQEFERVGGTRSIQVDVRLIATSNRDMKEAIDHKLFREDLYYRLNVVPLQLPPLRERKEDILPLAEYFLERLCEENHKPKKRLSSESKKKLLDYHWPGNIRELANIIERTVVMDSSDQIEPEHLCLDPLACKIKQTQSTLGMTLEELEKQHILDTLAAHHYNRTKAADALGISIRTLRNKMKVFKN
jgi:two-component system response regulator AtoC